MPNYRVNFQVIGLAEQPWQVVREPTGPTIGDRAPIEATGEAADEEHVFAHFAHAKTAAICHVDKLMADIKQERANIRGLKEKEVGDAQEAMIPADAGERMQDVTKIHRPLSPVGHENASQKPAATTPPAED